MKNRLYIILLIFLFSSVAKAQKPVNLDKTEHDFGDIVAGNERVADFILRNTGNTELFLLRADATEDCIVRFSEKIIPPQGQSVIRIKYNPEKKGRFQRKIAVYNGNSPDPFTLTIKGTVKELEDNPLTQCPDFNTAPADKNPTQSFTVEVIDGTTNQPVKKAKVLITSKQNYSRSFFTSADGKSNTTVPVGLYTVQVEAEQYTVASKNLYIGRGFTNVVITIEPDPTKIPVVASREEVPSSKPEETKPAPAVITDLPGELPRAEFSPNNIVFLIDVSSSMNTEDKLPLLKTSMKKLLYTLRDIDRVSIVTYASGTKIELPSTGANNKKQIAAIIDGLKPAGSTQGGKGIREAYRVAEENFIQSGNNQIILATDGDFNLDKSDDALFAFIEDKSGTGISLFVAGCGKKERAKYKMGKLAEAGKGSYVHVNAAGDVDAVFIEEIKSRSRKK